MLHKNPDKRSRKFCLKKKKKKKKMSTIKTLKHQLESINVTGPRYTGKSEFAQCRVTLDGKPLKVKLTGTLFMLPAKNEHDDYGTSFKMGVEFDEGDMIVFDTILEKMMEVVDDESYSVKPGHDDGNIFFKLPTNKALSEFTFESNVAIKPGKLGSDKLDQFMPVTIDLIVSGWYLKKRDEDVKKYGLTYKIRKVCFGNEKVKTPAVKRRKTEEDEVSISSK